MSTSFFIMFGTLTLVSALFSLVLAPSEKRLEFMIHITIVTLLTLVVVTLN